LIAGGVRNDQHYAESEAIWTANKDLDVRANQEDTFKLLKDYEFHRARFNANLGYYQTRRQN